MRSIQKLFASAALLGAISMAPLAAHADTTVTYNGFADTTGLTLVGNAATAVTGDGTVLRLTPADFGQSGAAYSTQGFTLGVNNTFSSTFSFRFTDTGGIDPADGITMVLAASPTGLGTGGGDLGYGGVPNSVAIEFDTFENGGVDANSNHVAVDTGGNLNNLDLTSPYGVTECDFFAGNSQHGCLSNGDLWTAAIDYNGTNLTVKVRDGADPFQTVINAYAIDIGAELGTNTAFVGFTAGTGSGIENQDVTSWSFSNTESLANGGVPEPAAWALMLMGFGGLGAALRARRRSLAAAA